LSNDYKDFENNSLKHILEKTKQPLIVRSTGATWHVWTMTGSHAISGDGFPIVLEDAAGRN